MKKSLKCYEVRRVDSDTMYADGYELFNQSRMRFGDKSLLVSKERWANRCKASEGKDLWMAYDKETGIAQAFAINKRYDDYCYYVTMGVNPDAPGSTYPMYGLIFEMNRYYIEDQRLKYVCDGARSVTGHSNIQPLLIDKFRFRKAYCDLRVYYKLWFGIVVKLLFPFRRWIKNKNVAAILRQEAWARGLEG